jgi:hypothetical protein
MYISYYLFNFLKIGVFELIFENSEFGLIYNSRFSQFLPSQDQRVGSAW